MPEIWHVASASLNSVHGGPSLTCCCVSPPAMTWAMRSLLHLRSSFEVLLKYQTLLLPHGKLAGATLSFATRSLYGEFVCEVLGRNPSTVTTEARSQVNLLFCHSLNVFWKNKNKKHLLFGGRSWQTTFPALGLSSGEAVLSPPLILGTGLEAWGVCGSLCSLLAAFTCPCLSHQTLLGSPEPDLVPPYGPPADLWS